MKIKYSVKDKADIVPTIEQLIADGEGYFIAVGCKGGGYKGWEEPQIVIRKGTKISKNEYGHFNWRDHKTQIREWEINKIQPLSPNQAKELLLQKDKYFKAF